MLAVTLLLPVLFLMAVVVFYGCLLAVLTHRLGLQSVTGRQDIGTTLIEPDRPDSLAARPLASTHHPAVRFLIVVSRQNPGRYEELRRIFGGQEGTEVIFDRRRPQHDGRRPPTSERFGGVERRERHVEEDLRQTGWAMLRLTG